MIDLIIINTDGIKTFLGNLENYIKFSKLHTIQPNILTTQKSQEIIGNY